MMRSMFSAISGLKNHQTFMDVVGNNIANVNTTGFKQSRVTFQDILSQTIRGASGPQNGRGGVNPEQVGLGVLLSGIDTIQTQGTLQSTGKLTDMAIQGDGFFMVNDGKQNFYTRDGAFDLGIDGTLLNPASGLKVMGWQADPVTGVVDTTKPTSSINIPIGAGMTGKGSTSLTTNGNLDSGTAAAAAVPLSATVYDTLGNAHQIAVTFTKSATADTWGISVASTETGVTAALSTGSASSVKFTTAGKYDTTANTGPYGISLTFTGGSGAGATTPLNVNLDMTTMTQLAAPSNLSSNTDGASAGNLTTFTVGSSGEITGVYSNGYKQPLGQIALASFANPNGLEKAGGNLFTTSPNSGNPSIGAPDTGGRGQIATGFLEGSNVDLAQQFTNMIMAERGFQANSRVITTSDEILQDLVNIKH
jgi:flagellar hook protein FlgE